MLADGEHTLTTPHPKLRIAKPRTAPDANWMNALFAWPQQRNPGTEQVRNELAARVPEYSPQAISAVATAAIPERPAGPRPD